MLARGPFVATAWICYTNLLCYDVSLDTARCALTRGMRTDRYVVRPSRFDDAHTSELVRVDLTVSACTAARTRGAR